MAGRVRVFVGPSFPEELPQPDGIERFPPAGEGDLFSARAEGVDVVGLIDGVVGAARPPSPRELRTVAAAGLRLVGGASLGALRAVESPDAIEGIGTIYEQFRSGELDGDDEVIGSFDLDNYQTIAFPLVRVRAAVASLTQQHLVPAHEAREIIERVQGLPFHLRTGTGVLRASQLGGARAQALRSALLDPRLDPKRRDALKVVARAIEIAGARASGAR